MDAVEDGQRHLPPFFERCNIGAAASNRVEVIFEEIVSNAVRHGFEANSGQTMHVWVSARPQAVELRFEDDGVPFNPVERAAPSPFQSLETAPLGGLGIDLVKKLAASMRYERLPGAPYSASAPGQAFAPSNHLIVTVSTLR